MKKKSKMTMDFMHPIVRLIEKYRLYTKLENEARIASSRIKDVLHGDIHDYFCRVIIALSRYVSREELEDAFNQSMNLVYGLKKEDLDNHSKSYSRKEWSHSPFTENKKRYIPKKKSEKGSNLMSNKNHD